MHQFLALRGADYGNHYLIKSDLYWYAQPFQDYIFVHIYINIHRLSPVSVGLEGINSGGAASKFQPNLHISLYHKKVEHFFVWENAILCVINLYMELKLLNVH